MNHDKQYSKIEARLAALERLVLQPKRKRTKTEERREKHKKAPKK